MKRILAVALVLAMMIPVAALGEATTLPFGLAFGMNRDEVKASFKADATLTKIKYDTEDYDSNSVEYSFENVTIPGSDVVMDSMTAQIDQNNSAKADRLSTLCFAMTPVKGSIAAFRGLLTALKATLGEPDSDPFDAAAVESYVEWGTLDASWTTVDTRVALSLNRMYEESITLQYVYRLNYDPADLAE